MTKPHTFWKHANGNFYEVMSTGKVKINGVWEDSVNYTPFPIADNMYTRELINFLDRFKPASESEINDILKRVRIL